MYKIYYNDKLFFQDTTPAEQFKLIDPTLELSANSSGSLSFTMTTTNIMYDDLQRMKGLVKVTKHDKTIWEGRVLSEKIDFWKNKEIYCEGILSCLNDTRQPQNIYKDITLRQYIEGILSIHNQKVDASKKLNLGIVTVNDNTTIGTIKTNYDSTWDLFKNLITTYGGYLFIRYDGTERYLDYRKDCPRTSSQRIEFGVNLLDFTKTYDMSSLVTVLLPLGKTLAYAGGKSIGDIVDSRLAAGHYISSEDFDIYYNPNEVGTYSGSNTYFPVEAGKTYYISCRNREGRIMWALKDSNWNLVDYYSASSNEGMTDLVESKIEIPKSDVGNTYYLAIAGFGEDIQPRVNSAIEAGEDFDKYVTVESANNGSIYVVNEESVSNYGWIEKQLTWGDTDDPQKLKELAETYLKDGQFDEMTLEVSAVDLQLMGINIDSINILDEVHVVSKPHGLDKTFPVTELTIKMGETNAGEFTLGHKTEQTLSGIVNDANEELFEKLNAIPSQSSTLKSAKDNASQLIKQRTSGIFTLLYDENGNNTGFKLSNVPDWESDGAKGWLFTMGGLGYFGDGYDQPVTIALTGEDGGLVANSVTTGELSADRIRGGVLGLGHWLMPNGEYIDGRLQVCDQNGKIVVDMGLLDNGTYGAKIQGEFESSGVWGRTISIRDGWIGGGSPDTGHLAFDNMLYDRRLTSLETTDLFIGVSNELIIGTNKGDGGWGDMQGVTKYAHMYLKGYYISDDGGYVSPQLFTVDVKQGFVLSVASQDDPYAVSKDDIISLEDQIDSLNRRVDILEDMFNSI